MADEHPIEDESMQTSKSLELISIENSQIMLLTLGSK